MAKLEGVKVIDMKDGEVTKIAYEGVEYVRVETDRFDHTEGDIVLNLSDRRDAPAGDYFVVAKDGRVYDNAEDAHSNIQHDCVVFRKVEAPSLDSRVTKLEQDVEEIKAKQQEEESEEVSEGSAELKYSIGDKVRITTEGTHCFSKGEVVEIFEIDDDAGNSQPYKARYLNGIEPWDGWVFENEVEPLTPKVGDKLRVVNAIYTGGAYDNGDVLTVVHIDSAGDIYVKEHDIVILPREVEIMTTPEIKAWEKEQNAEFAKFSEGDKVRLVSGGGNFPLKGYKDGEVYTVYKAKFYHENGYRVQIKDGKVMFGYATPDQLEKISEKEAVEIEKWASIGREVDEFKAGDIAEVVHSPNASPVGTLVSITKVDVDSILAIGWSVPLGKTLGYAYNKENLKLITPAEHRFDRD